MEYTRVKVRNSYCVSYFDDNGCMKYCIIHYFVQFISEISDETRIFAIISELHQPENPTVTFPMDGLTGRYQMNHMKIFDLPNKAEKKAIDVMTIQKLCVYMDSHNNKVYVCAPPNSVENE